MTTTSQAITIPDYLPVTVSKSLPVVFVRVPGIGDLKPGQECRLNEGDRLQALTEKGRRQRTWTDVVVSGNELVRA